MNKSPTIDQIVKAITIPGHDGEDNVTTEELQKAMESGLLQDLLVARRLGTLGRMNRQDFRSRLLIGDEFILFGHGATFNLPISETGHTRLVQLGHYDEIDDRVPGCLKSWPDNGYGERYEDLLWRRKRLIVLLTLDRGVSNLSEVCRLARSVKLEQPSLYDALHFGTRHRDEQTNGYPIVFPHSPRFVIEQEGEHVLCLSGRDKKRKLDLCRWRASGGECDEIGPALRYAFVSKR